MKKHIQEFIDFNYKELTFWDFFIAFFILSFFTFLIVPINVEKMAVTYFAFIIDIAYIVVSIFVYKLPKSQKRTFFFDAIRNEFISVMFCLFVAGFMNHYLLFFLLEFILIILFGALTVLLACHSIKKRAFSKEKLKGKGKISIPLIMSFSISIDVPNGFMFGLLMIVGVLLGGNGGFLLKVYLLICNEKKITNKFIDYLNTTEE